MEGLLSSVRAAWGALHGIPSAGQGTGLSLKLIPDSSLKSRVLPAPEPITIAPGLPTCRSRSTGKGRRPSAFLGGLPSHLTR